MDTTVLISGVQQSDSFIYMCVCTCIYIHTCVFYIIYTHVGTRTCMHIYTHTYNMCMLYVYTHAYTQIIFHCRLLQDIEYSSLFNK